MGQHASYEQNTLVALFKRPMSTTVAITYAPSSRVGGVVTFSHCTRYMYCSVYLFIIGPHESRTRTLSDKAFYLPPTIGERFELLAANGRQHAD